MKGPIQIRYIFWAIFIVFNVLNATKDEEIKMPMRTNSPSSPRTYGQYFQAVFDMEEGKINEAQEKFNELNATSASTVIQPGHIRFLRKTKQFNKILQQPQILAKESADDPDVQIITIEALINTNKQQQAIQKMVEAIDKFPDNQQLAMIAVQWYLSNRNPTNALIVIDRYLSNAASKPNNYQFLFIKANILALQNQIGQARDAAKECLAANRNFERCWLLYAQIEEQLGNLDQAIKGYKTFLDLVGREAGVQNHLLDLLYKQKMIKEHKTIQSIPMTYLQKGLLLLEQNQPAEALTMIEECLKQEPNNTEAIQLKIQILENLGALQQAFKLTTDLMNAQPMNELWFKTAASLQKKGIKRHQLVAAYQQVEQKNPRSLLPAQYLADLYLRANNQQQALIYLQKVIDSTSDNLLKTKAHYQKARIFHQHHNTQAMATELEKGRAIYANFAPLNNMLAYYYAAKGNNHSKALELVNKSLASEPTNPHYLDTLGYISYKQGDAQKALKIIEPLASRIPDDTVIENHVRKINQELTHNDKSRGI